MCRHACRWVEKRVGADAAASTRAPAAHSKHSPPPLTNTHKPTPFIKPPKQILREVNAPFEAVNVLEADALRSGMKAYSAWPTFPQVYIGGEFFGGADIMIGAF
jgi:glutaredoxin